jgi:hypothetical protein
VGARLRDALVGWRRYPAATVIAGAGKVPFSRGNLSSSAASAIVVEPVVIERLGIDRRVGLAVYGELGMLSYGAGVYNADPALSFGNRADGILGVGRVEAGTADIGYGQSTVGPGSDAQNGVRVGGSFAYRRDATLKGYSAGGDLGFKHAMLAVNGEFLMGKTEPLEEPMLPTPAGGAVDVTTMGGYFTFAVNLVKQRLEVAGRFEYFDGNTSVEDENDLLVFAGGFNSGLVEDAVKAGLSYVHKRERSGRALENDALILQLQASF